MKILVLAMFLLTFILFGADVKIPIQGFLVDNNGIALNGTQEMKFTLFDSDVNGNVLWSNQDTASIEVEKGEFSYMLGTTDVIDSTVLENATPLYLGIKIGDEVLSPRIELGVESKAIYAYKAENSDKLEGKSLEQVKNETLGNILSRLEDLETANNKKDTKIEDLEMELTALKNRVKTLEDTKFDGNYNSLINKPITITSEQANAITTNTQKIGITQEQANAITTNTSGVSSNLTKITDLETKTEDMTIVTDNGYKTVRFSNVNVQIVSGSGTTNGAINGRGNLIVGYNEARTTGSDKTGSHNLVVGLMHNYSSYGGSVFGRNNIISGDYSSVSGGSRNTASGGYSSVSGGYNNMASALYSSVSGGSNNTASGETSSVSGGNTREASGAYDWRAGSLLENN
jgi:hypothetical protein